MAISSAVIGPQPLSVTGFIRYSERAADGGWIERDGRSSFGTEDHEVEIHNARMTQTCFEKQGFTLVKQATDVDFTNLVDVEQRYYPAVCERVKKLTGASEVFPFLGVLRGGSEDLGGGPALSAHVDFNGPALKMWLQRLVPDRAEELSAKRLVNFNVWRPTHRVQNFPLALCDASSVERRDFLHISFGKPEGVFTKDMPAGLNMAFNPRHKWYYYPDMEPDEALIFRLFDTANPHWKMTGHTAFADPTSVPGTPKRQSFEVRTIAVFND